jgi:hypothetical protein
MGETVSQPHKTADFLTPRGARFFNRVPVEAITTPPRDHSCTLSPAKKKALGIRARARLVFVIKCQLEPFLRNGSGPFHRLTVIATPSGGQRRA